MRNKLLVLLTASTILLGGCSTAAVETDDSNETPNVETTDEETPSADEDTTTEEDTSLSGDLEEGENEETTEDDSSEDSVLSIDEYESQIESEVEEAVSSASSLTDEIDKICSLSDQYEMMLNNVETQAEMNLISQCPLLVWNIEAESLLDRIKEADADEYKIADELFSEFEETSYDMAEKMAYEYDGGSIQAMIINGYLSELYRNQALELACRLAEINNDTEFEAPDFGPTGIYGEYLENEYLIFTIGMEDGSYNVLIHRDGEDDIIGTAIETGEEDVYDFTSEDGSISGTLELGLSATLTVTESTDSNIKVGDKLFFDGKY